MAGDRKQAKKRDQEYHRLEATFSQLRTKGPYLKKMLRARGYDVPFYDFYDSYTDEFSKIVTQAVSDHPTLLGVFEVDDPDYFGSDHSKFAPGMTQIFWRMPQEPSGYGKKGDESNISGNTMAFHTASGELKTLVHIRKKVPDSKPHREFRYIMKLIALLHELGHVHDMEHAINFKHALSEADIIEAEVFAHLYALEWMAKQNYCQCFLTLVDALKKHIAEHDYRGTVSKLVIERMPEYQLVDVHKVPLEPITAEDKKVLGPDGIRAICA